MKKLRKAISIALTLALVVSMALFAFACGGDDGGNKKPDDGDGTDIKYTVTLQRSSGDPISGAVVLASNGSTTEYGITDNKGAMTFTSPKGTYNLTFGTLPDGYNATGTYTIDDKTPQKTFKLSASLISQPAAANTKYTIGSVMHDFEYKDSRGNSGSLSGLLAQKKAVLINFWFITCDWCVKEFPDMKTAYEKYSDDIAVLAMSWQDTQANVEAFRTDINDKYVWDELPFIMTGSESDSGRVVSNCFGISTCPQSILVDREGVICAILPGYGTLEEFEELFEYFTSEPYTQKIYFSQNADKPDVAAPSSAAVATALNASDIAVPTSYYFDKGEYNWPWIVSDGGVGIQASNSEKSSSYAIMYADITVDENEVIAFDYKLSTEEDYDIFYVFVDNVIMHTFSGVTDDWKTCYAYVPIKSRSKYTLSFVYQKDNRRNVGDDTVYLKNLRTTTVDAIDARTEMIYRCASGAMVNGHYSDYITPVYNETDKYYHVDSADGPLLLADLMNGTGWSNDSAWVHVMKMTKFEYDGDGDGIIEDHKADFTTFSQIANNSRRHGLLAVTKELKTALDALTAIESGNHHDREWLELCSFINVYGTDKPEQLGDPAEGLADYNAYTAVVSESSSDLKYNHVDKQNVIMPRGLWYKFEPSVTAVYKVFSVGECDTYCWIYDDKFNAIAENDDDQNSTASAEERFNFGATALFKAGTAYYILCDFNNTDALGAFDFAITKIATSGKVWGKASSGEYGLVYEGDKIAGYEIIDAVDYVEKDGYYYVKNSDGSAGEPLYINLLGATDLFPDMSVENMLGISCYYCKLCGSKYYSSVEDFEKSDVPKCWCPNADKTKFAKKKTFELPTPMRGIDKKILAMQFTYDDGTTHLVPQYQLDTDDVVTPAEYGDFLASGVEILFTDYTDTVRSYIAMAKDAANNPTDPQEIGATEAHTGYVRASTELVDIIQKMIVFGDYSISPLLDNAWLMLAYHYTYIGE